MKIENIRPGEIESRSFEIITELLGDKKLDPRYESVIKRCIHTSADLDYADNLYFTDGVIETIQEAIKSGAYIVTDTQMARAGINKRRIEKYGGQVLCFIGDDDVAAEAKARGVTRSFVSMEKASRLDRQCAYSASFYLRFSKSRKAFSGSRGRRARGFRQRGGIQGEAYRAGCTGNCGQRQKGRKQYRRSHHQCDSVQN